MRNLLDITGQKYGRLTVLSRTGNRQWLCACECGNQKPVRKANLLNGTTRSCGCFAREATSKRNSVARAASCGPRPGKDLTGQRFGMLLVRAYEFVGTRKSVWICDCDCGIETRADGPSLKRGKKKSCGCLSSAGIQYPRQGKRNRRRYAPPVPHHARTVDLTGRKFGRLTAIHFVGDQAWYCSCDCGGSTIATGRKLRSGNSKSCGCARSESVRAAMRIRWDGFRKTPFKRPAVLRSGLKVTNVLWSLICRAWRDSCAYCEKPTSALTIDHIHAIALGGDHVLGNIAPACLSCNTRKQHRELTNALVWLGSENFHQRRLAAIVRLQEILHA